MIETQNIVEILRKVPLWSGLSPDSLEQLASEFEIVELAADETVFREGDPGDSMYVVVDGLVRVHCEGRDLKKLGAWNFFGEMALFEDAPRSASITSIEKTTLLRLQKEAFLHLLHNRIEVAIGMLHEFSNRLNGYLKTVGSLRDFIERDLLPLGIALSSEKSLDLLLPRILDEARKHSGADSGAIYLLQDDGTMKAEFVFCDSLGIAVSQPMPDEECQYGAVTLFGANPRPALPHVVAVVAAEKASINLADIYHATDYDFSDMQRFDKDTGYRAKSCLTVPLKNNEGEVIGVVQLLNTKDPDTRGVVPFGASEQLVVESLSSLAAVALNTKRLLDRQSAFLKVEHDLEIGRQIQLDFLPESIPQPEGWQIDARFHPARQVGGDFYDVFPTTGGLIGFALADVCDKGVGAALYMALSRSLIRAFSWDEERDERHKVASAANVDAMWESALRPMETANQYLTSFHLKMNMFVTCFFGLLEPSTGRLRYINAGHNAPLLVSANGTLKARLTTTSPALGIFPGAKFKSQEAQMGPGDLLFVFTDGVTEARGPNREFYTDDRLVKLLERPRPSAKWLLDQVEADVKAHVNGAEQSDDITMVAIRRIPLRLKTSGGDVHA